MSASEALAAIAAASGKAVFARRIAIPLFPALLMLASGAACAQQQGSREQEMIRRLRLQVSQLQQDLGAQQQQAQQAAGEAAALKQKLAQADTELGQTRKSVATESRAAAQARQMQQTSGMEARNRLELLQAELERTRADLERARAEGVRRDTALGECNAAHAALQARHAEQAQGLQTCIANNARLLAVGKDLLQRYGGISAVDVAARNEPFLQFKRVELENLVQNYEDKLDQQALKTAPPASAAETAR